MDWKALVGTFAPYLGAALGGPLGGAAVGMIADALSLDDKSEASIKNALQGITPDQVAAIKAADQQFQVRMRELDIDSVTKIEALAVSDRDSARKREISVGDRTPQILVFAILVAWIIANVFLFSTPIPEGNKELLSRALGSLDTLLGLAFAYFYGSTAGGKLKSELLAKSTPT